MTTIRVEYGAWCHTPFVIDDAFGKLMILLVTEDSRELEIFFGW